LHLLSVLVADYRVERTNVESRKYDGFFAFQEIWSQRYDHQVPLDTGTDASRILKSALYLSGVSPLTCLAWVTLPGA